MSMNFGMQIFLKKSTESTSHKGIVFYMFHWKTVIPCFFYNFYSTHNFFILTSKPTSLLNLPTHNNSDGVVIKSWSFGFSTFIRAGYEHKCCFFLSSYYHLLFFFLPYGIG